MYREVNLGRDARKQHVGLVQRKPGWIEGAGVLTVVIDEAGPPDMEAAVVNLGVGFLDGGNAGNDAHGHLVEVDEAAINGRPEPLRAYPAVPAGPIGYGMDLGLERE